MRLLPILSGFMLLSAVAMAQPAPDAPLDQSPPPAPEQPGPPAPHARGNFVQRFQAANTTNDGRLTLQQAQAGGLMGVARHFDQIDTDHKGYVTLQDMHAWRQGQLRQRQGNPNPPPPPAPPQ